MKKAGLVFLAVLLCFTFVYPASASNIPIGGINEARWYDGQTVMQDAANVRDLMSVRVSAGAEIRIYLDADMFVDQNGVALGTSGEGVSPGELQRSRVKIVAGRQQTPNIIDEITFEYDHERKTSYIRIKFIDPYTGTRRQTWKADLKLSIDGITYISTEFRIEATLSNSEIELYANTIYVSLEHDEYATARVFLRNVTVDLGKNVTIVTHMEEGKKYYGLITPEIPPEAKNAEIFLNYRLTHSNLAHNSSICRFTFDDRYYVYNSNGDYLGTTAEDMPVLRQYLFTTEYVEALEVEGRKEPAAAADETGSGSGQQGGGGQV